MAHSLLKRDSDSLLQILNSLLQTSQNEGNCIGFKIFDCKDGFVIYHIPAGFKHPLKDIINDVEKHFFLVSKLPEALRKVTSESQDEEMPEQVDINHEADLTIPVMSQHHVYVGTPISQKIYHLFCPRDLQGHETETIEKHMDISGLEKLDVKYARYFLSLYTQCSRCQTDLPEVWVRCDQQNYQGVSYLGLAPCVSEKPGQQINTVMVKSQNVDCSKKDGFTLSEQKKRHLVFNRASHAQTHGYARYDIYGVAEGIGKDTDQPESRITLEFAWDGVHDILQPPPPSSNAVLNICVHPDDVKSILSVVTSELDLLINHFAAAQGRITRADDEQEFDHQELERKVLTFVDDLKHSSFGSREQSVASVNASPTTNIAAPFGITEALKRQDLDNTESLWLFLMNLTSNKKILFCLDVIFSLLCKGEYQPVLSAANQTQVARLMKEVVCCKTDQEKANIKAKISHSYTPGTALQCVVEVGLEKLQNDYMNYFIKQELVTMDKLEYYLAKDLTMAEKFQRLLKLHCILSLIALAISYAHIMYDDLRELVTAALKFYQTNHHTEHPVFSLSLPAFSASSSNVKNICIHQFQPQSWMAAITSMNRPTTVIQMEACDRFGTVTAIESFVEHDKSFKSSKYVAATATSSCIHI